MTESEVESDTQVLLISLDDMLEQRKTDLEEVNKKYGTNISVSINERFDVTKNVNVSRETLKEGGEEDVTERIS